MCGICGYLSREGPATAESVRAMAGTLAHRGPDGEGLHLDGPVALGHRRLSIIDLSEAASEPMTNEDGSLWLVFNGEIYNFREIRRGSRGPAPLPQPQRRRGDPAPLRGEGRRGGRGARRDVRVRALGRDGGGGFCSRATAWGRSRSSTTTGRGLFAFASETKALLAHPGVPHERDPEALPLFLTYGYVPTPGTFYRGIRALPPGHSWR